MDYDKLKEQKEHWLKEGFISGVALCDFFLMKDLGVDIVYNNNDIIVQEFITLLESRLESKNFSLVLLSTTELEHCLMDPNDNLYSFLSDEIYEHFINNNGDYPLQAVGFQIDILRALSVLEEGNRVGRYLRTLKDTYIQLWGDDSYLFSKNWSYILDEVALPLIPDIAISEFEQYQNIFSTNLKDEVILYKLCLGVGGAKAKSQRKAEYLKDAASLCKTWYIGISQNVLQVVRPLVEVTLALYNRYIGEFDAALKHFESANTFSNIHQFKLYIQCQIGTILYAKHDVNALGKFLAKNETILEELAEIDENIAELHNLKGLYFAEIGEFADARIEIEKAIGISERVLGNLSDVTVRFRINLLFVKVLIGEYINSELEELFQIILQDYSIFPESFPLILNLSNYLLSIDVGMNGRVYREAKKILDNKIDSYDIVSSVVFKCNLYCSIMESNRDIDTAKGLRLELEAYFDRYPNSNGYLQYLQGEFYRCSQESEMASLNILKKIDKYLSGLNLGISSWYHVYKSFVRVRLSLWEHKYVTAKKQLKAFWIENIIPLFRLIGERDLKDAEMILKQLRSYASFYVSAVQQYPEMGITIEDLYEFVLNFKYLYFQFNCAPKSLLSIPKNGNWLSVYNEISMCNKGILIECFDYTRYELKDYRAFVGVTVIDYSETVNQIYFTLRRYFGRSLRYGIEVIWDGQFAALNKKLVEAFESEQITRVEQDASAKLMPLLENVDIIYICTDIIPLQITTAMLRIDGRRCLGELCQIIYCNTGKDVGKDIAIQDISNSVFFGMSRFDGDIKNIDNRLHKQLPDLFFSELEVKRLGALTGGQVYLNQKAPKDQGNWRGKSVIHFATHAVDQTGLGTKALIFGKDEGNYYTSLTPTDISEMDWSGVNLVVFSACETNDESFDHAKKNSLQLAAKNAGAIFSISTFSEVEDGVNAFFMVCFYKNLIQYRMICMAFFQTQKIMRSITKREILSDCDYINIGMEYYLQDFQDDERPFSKNGEWALYLLQMNERKKI